jgi:DNA invertase Pin-like site-specific DNA recombinase
MTVPGATPAALAILLRKRVMELARSRKMDAVLVTELTRWGRSTLDLVQTMNDLQSWGVSLVAITGLTFDLSSATGKLLATLLAGIAEFERDMLVERVLSGLATPRRQARPPGGTEFVGQACRPRAEPDCRRAHLPRRSAPLADQPDHGDRDRQAKPELKANDERI